MHDLTVIEHRNVDAVRREVEDAIRRGDYLTVARIIVANPDIADRIIPREESRP